jgi:hypothetical protein
MSRQHWPRQALAMGGASLEGALAGELMQRLANRFD